MAYFRMDRVMKDESDYRSVAESFLNNLRLQKTDQMAAMSSMITLKNFGGRKGLSQYYQKHFLPTFSDSVISLKPAGRGVIFKDDDYNVGIEFTGTVIPKAGEGKKIRFIISVSDEPIDASLSQNLVIAAFVL